MEGLLGTLCDFGLAGALRPVDTEVEVEAQVLETVDLVVKLRVADETVGGGPVFLLVEGGDRVGRSHGVDVAVGISPDAVAVQAAFGVVQINRLGRVIAESLTDGALVGVPVLGEGVLAVEVDAEVLVEEGRGEGHGGRSAVHLGALQGTLLHREAAGNAVRERDGLTDGEVAVDGDVGVHGRGGAVDLLLPVGVGGAEDIEGRSGHLAVSHALGDQGAHLVAGQDILVLGDGVDGGRQVHGDVRDGGGMALGTLLRGDDDNAVGSTGTVDGGRGGVLEDGEGLDVFRVDGGQRIAHAGDAVIGNGQAVNDVERVVGRVQGCTATDTDRCAGARHTGTGSDDDTGALAAEEVSRGRDDTLVDLVGLDRCDGTRKVTLLDGTVTDHDDVIEILGVALEREGCRNLIGGEGDGSIAHAADFHQCGRTGHRQDIVAVQTGRDAVARSLFENDGAHHRAEFVDYNSLYLISALGEYSLTEDAG